MSRVDDYACREVGTHILSTRHTESECGLNEPPKFLVFAYMTYYPGGGWNDHKGSFQDLEEAKEFALKQIAEEGYDYTDVVDLSTGKIVR